MKLDITVGPFGGVKANPEVKVDWYSIEARAKEKLAKAKARRDQADFDVQQAEQALEAVKRDRLAAGVR